MNHSIRYILAAITILFFAGCTGNRVDLDNVTPSMDTLSQTYSETDVDLAMTDNQNLRMAQEDLGRVWYTNKPSSLSPYPVVNTTGNPP
ncbi:MAG: hypothetical protein QF444_05260 [Phycisphaerales bacterium]|jgi:PBP1b-binding outer membrane lipoprotein LpoB|nr:hypothetical protein [Phycisphaerales bacterium]